MLGTIPRAGEPADFRHAGASFCKVLRALVIVKKPFQFAIINRFTNKGEEQKSPFVDPSDDHDGRCNDGAREFFEKPEKPKEMAGKKTDSPQRDDFAKPDAPDDDSTTRESLAQREDGK